MVTSDTYIRSKRSPLSATRMRWPSPELALIISVANMTMKDSASDTRRPAKISGRALGSTTLRKNYRQSAPNLRAERGEEVLDDIDGAEDIGGQPPDPQQLPQAD